MESISHRVRQTTQSVDEATAIPHHLLPRIRILSTPGNDSSRIHEKGARLSWLRFISVFFLACMLFFLPGTGSSEVRKLQDEAGFAQVRPVDFYFQKDSSRLDLKSSTARMWYSFQPADENAARKPLFVIFNGGPGCATSSGLLSYNTSRMTVDSKLNGGKVIGPNPVSWTGLGNLLYIDARDSGFSYNLMQNSQSKNARAREFDAQNFNSFIDGADFIRLLLRFLASHPAIQKNPVIIVGESYGGIRATVMLHMLLNYRDYANGKVIYQDKGLVREIQAHYNTVFPAWSNKTVPPQVAAKQFGRQLLVQPLLSGRYQDKIAGEMYEQKGSVIFQIAEETGTRYVPCTQYRTCDPYDRALQFVDSTALRDIYGYSKPRDWLMNLFTNAGRKIQYTETLSTLVGMDVTSVDHMYASNRNSAYRVVHPGSLDLAADTDAGLIDYGLKKDTSRIPVADRIRMESLMRICKGYEPMAAGDMSSVFGTLQAWDAYFIMCNDDPFYAYFDNKAIRKGYNIDEMAPLYGDMFLKNVVHVKTFITNAANDLVIFSSAIPKALSLHDKILSSVLHDTKPRKGVAREGWIVLNYKPGAFPDISDIETRTIRFPIYSRSCHSVSVTQPRELFKDVSAWLAQ